MDSLIKMINWDKVKGVCYGLGGTLLYYAIADLYTRLANAEAMIMLIYRAMSGQAS